MNIKKCLVSLSAICAFALYANAAMASTEATKIAIIDSQKLDESTAIKGIRDQVNKKVEAVKKEASAKEKDLKKRFDDLESNKRKLSKEAFEKEKDALSKEAEGFQRKGYDERMKIEKAYADAMAQVEKALNGIIQRRAEKEGYGIVMFKMSTVFSAPSLDITSGVLVDLNKELPKVEVVFPK